MPEYRDCQVLTNIEATVAAEVNRVTQAEKITASNYVRSLIIRDLTERGLLTADKLVRMTTTDSIKQMQDRINANNGNQAAT